MAIWRTLLSLLLLAVSGRCSSDTLIPFIAWSNGNTLSALSSKQPHTIQEFVSGAELNEIEVFVVFKVSKLSFDDIAKFGGVYGEKHSALASLQSNLQSARSTLWSGMHGQVASNLVSSLFFNYDIIPNNIISADEVSLDHAGKQLYVVLLPEDDTEERKFLEQDKVISQVMSVVTKSKKPYVALYTADHSTQRTPQMQVHVFEAKRQTQERDYVDIDNYWDEMNINSTGTVCAMMSLANVTSHKRNLDCPMMCLTTPFYILDRENRTSGGNGPTDNHHPYVTIDHADTIKFIAGSCLQGNETERCKGSNAPYFYVQANFNSTGPVMFLFLFKQGIYGSADNCSIPGGFWTIDLEIGNERYRRYSDGLLFSKFEVPIGTSYACGNNSHNMFVHGNETSSTYPAYKFTSMQAQIGGTFSMTSFASAYNCESYFSHVSLMGIFTVIILLVVLYCSTVFMFQMKTLDKFDDPRGPTITVENLH